MQVESAILADFVQESQGKLYIVGGGIDRIFVNSVPARYPSIGLAFRLILSPGEYDRTHQLEIVLVNADGGRIAAVNVNIQVARPEQGTGWPVSLPLAINFSNIEFPAWGDYQFDLLCNGSSIKTVLFRIVSVEGGRNP